VAPGYVGTIAAGTSPGTSTGDSAAVDPASGGTGPVEPAASCSAAMASAAMASGSGGTASAGATTAVKPAAASAGATTAASAGATTTAPSAYVPQRRLLRTRRRPSR